MVTAFAGRGPAEDAAPANGAVNANAEMTSAIVTMSAFLFVSNMFPSSLRASLSFVIKVSRNRQPDAARTVCGGWEFPLRARRAEPLNPRTPARPDLKSGAVVLAWLPPRAAHRTCGIMPFGARRTSRARDLDPGETRRPRASSAVFGAEDLLRAERVGSPWVVSTRGWRSSPAGAAG